MAAPDPSTWFLSAFCGFLVLCSLAQILFLLVRTARNARRRAKTERMRATFTRTTAGRRYLETLRAKNQAHLRDQNGQADE